MYSPMSPRSRLSAKNSPHRRPLLTPTELSPFSFSSDNLHKYLEDDTSLPSSSATGLGIDENGKVAMPMLSVPGSQPRTPLASSTPRLNTLVTGAQSAPGIHQRSYSLNGSILGSLNSSTGLGGQGVREADDTIRDLRKENFNLKLRIYFLDERLGSKSSSSGSHANQEELLNSNMELKIQCESLKNDMKEKTQLLSEASQALDQLESKLASLTDEREEEKKSLEEKLKLLESNEHHEEDGVEDDDQDTHLIHELEEELRGIKQSSNNIKPERGCQTEYNTHHQRLPSSSVLGSVPEEKDVEQLAAKIEDLENSLDQMTVVIHDTETCLVEAQQKASSWQEEVSKRDSQIETLLREGRMKGEAAVRAQQELAELATKATDQAEESEGKVKALFKEKEALQDQFVSERHDLLSKVSRLQIIVNDKDQECKALTLELEEKKAQLEMLNELKDSNSPRKEMENEDEKNSSCSSPDGAYKIVHQYVPTCRQLQMDKHRKLQVVTQTLHIPPAVAAIESNAPAELEKLRKEVKKLREYARLSVQDRKVLIHKIGTLKDKVHETSVRKSASPLRSLSLTDSSVQCDLIEMANNGKNQETDQWNLMRLAGLQQKLVSLGEAADLMKSQLEALVETLQPEALSQITHLNLGIGTTLAHLTQSSHQLLLSVRKTLEEVRDPRNNQDLDQRATESPDLPDPNEVELPEHPKDALIRHLYEDIEGKDKELEDKKQVISALSEQVGLKDKVIREQADHLDEYRVEILHLRDEGEQRERKVQPHHQHQDFDMERKCNIEGHGGTAEAEEAASSGFNKNPRIANSEDDDEEEDSWSEPDVDASRMRMGLSHQTLTLMEKTCALLNSNAGNSISRIARGDSSETEEQFRQRHCINGDLGCIVNGLEDYARLLDELSYQLNVSDTLHLSSEDSISTTTDFEKEKYKIEGSGSRSKLDQASSAELDLNFQLCSHCHSTWHSTPMETYLIRSQHLVLNSTLRLKKLRHLAYIYKRQLRQSHENASEKALVISQLEDSVHRLGCKVELLNEEAEKKSKDLTELSQKLNENYRMVAELSSDNLRLSTEKAAAEQLLDEVKHEQTLLKEELSKAQKVVKNSLQLASTSNVIRASSPETSASSFDFYAGSHVNRKSNRRRGSMPPPQARGGRSRATFRKHWTASGASSDYNTSENSPRKQRCSSSSSRAGTKSGTNVGTDLSSPDLGVDLVCSDPFSSLERGSANADCLSDFSQFQALMEENKRLKQDKERLSEKLTQSKGALRETLDRLHKKDFHVSPLHQSSRSRIFSSAVAAAVSNKPPPPTLKEEFLAFSHSHALNKKTKMSRQTSHEKQ